MTGKLKSLSKTKKVLLGIGGIFVLLVVIGAFASPPEENNSKELIQNASSVKGESDDQDSAKKKPKVETKIVEEPQEIPYQKVTQNDSNLAEGTTTTTIKGVNGVKILVYEVTYTDGVETSKKQISEQVSKQPVNEIAKIGTKKSVAPAPAPSGNCDPNYSGCVPIASDVDCAGGSGNGPAYVSGPISVTGVDTYDLDRDNDGVACE
jgi:resuscitation-promoting factor RpfB